VRVDPVGLADLDVGQTCVDERGAVLRLGQGSRDAAGPNAASAIDSPPNTAKSSAQAHSSWSAGWSTAGPSRSLRTREVFRESAG
jgi:hypothetical protein